MNSGFKCVLSSFGLFAARLAAAALMILGHGWGKVNFEKFEETAAAFPDPLNIGAKWSYIGALAGEVVCPALVAIGLFTRFATLGTVFTMAVAAFVVHEADPWFMAQAKGGGNKEPALLYLTLFALFFFTGPGKISLDALIFRGRKQVVVTPDVKPASTRPI